MASSQIEIVSAPHVLRDHNLRIRDRERECSSKARFTFQKNIDELVRDHLNNCWGSNKQLMSLSKNDENVKGAESEIRQTQVLDKCAARQAREMITTIEKQTHKAELLQLSSTSQSVSERASTFLRETSPCLSDSSVDQNNVGSVVPNLRASSLVQMWKEFEAEVTTPRANTNTHYKRLNSMKSNHENSSVGESPIGSDTDERFDNFTEWENEPTAAPVPVVEQRPASVQRQDSESSEGRRVADIVKRLTSGSQTTHSSLNSNSSCNENENANVNMNVNENDPEQTVLRDSSMSIDHSDQGEQRDLRLKRKRFTVRGREATKDLLLQMEQERHNELKKLAEFHAVSMFQQRGRIQSMLRLRFLQRGIVVQDQKRPASRVSELDQLHKRSSIVHLRERFGTKFQKDQNAPALNENDLHVTAQVPTVTPDSGLKVDEQILQTHTERKSEEIFIEDNLRTHTELVRRSALDLANAQVLNTESANRPVSVEDKLENHMQILDVTLDSSSVPVLNEANLKRHTEVISSTLGSSKVPVLVEKTSQVYTQFVNSTEDPIKSDTSDRLSVQSVHHKDDTMSEHSSQIVTVEYSMPSISEPIGQAESLSVPSTADYVQETKCWFSDITSDNLDLDGPMGDNKTTLGIMEHIGAIDDWEMLTEAPDFSTHQLRESTAVSWLNKVSCAPRGWESQKQTWCDEGLENGSDNEDFHALLDRRPVTNLLASSFRERMERMLLSRLQRHPEMLGDADQDEIIAEYNAIGDNHDQAYSPSLQLPLPSDLLRQWNHSQDQETSEDSGTCRSLQLPQPSSAGYPDSQHCSPFRNHPSLEMEMIYELKGHVERLQYEITELRESLKSMGAEVKLSGVPKRKICCICYSMQVDSLLYRCGHMCTCFKCAHELQWNNSNCPICRSPILDVVRAYSDQ